MFKFEFQAQSLDYNTKMSCLNFTQNYVGEARPKLQDKIIMMSKEHLPDYRQSWPNLLQKKCLLV